MNKLFDSAVYKNTLYRYKWGAVLFAVVLFLCGPFAVISESSMMALDRAYIDTSLFNSLGFFCDIAAVLTAPTITAMLVFRFMHSRRQALFISSLPVPRRAAAVSAGLAGYTLMALPVLLNTLILIMITASGAGYLRQDNSIMLWTMFNLYVLFVMFAAATLAAVLTGNTAVAVVVNIVIHTLPLIAYGTAGVIADAFLRGYVDNPAIYSVTRISPLVWVIEKGGMYIEWEFFSYPGTWLHLAGAAALYALTVILYSVRGTEHSGEAAGFRVMKPVLKYTVTAAAGLFAMFIGSLADNLLPAVIVTIVVYFACDMVINKSIHITGKSWLGLLIFSVCTAAVFMFCGMTTFFGYETRVPKPESVSTVRISCYGDDAPEMGAEDFIVMATKIHRDIVRNTDEVVCEDGAFVNIDYKLKNGRMMKRRYHISYEYSEGYMTKLYGNLEYKRKSTGISSVNIENVGWCELITCEYEIERRGISGEDAKTLMRMIDEDIRSMTYEEYSAGYGSDITYEVQLVEYERDIEVNGYSIFNDPYRYRKELRFVLNPAYKNTMQFLREHGYIIS